MTVYNPKTAYRRLSWLALVFLFTTLLSTSLNPSLRAQAASPASYFSQTGHYLTDSFKTYWENNGGLEQFGYPLTEPLQEVSPTDGKIYLTQYFQRAIFEFHPELAGTKYEVLLRLIGNIITQGRTFAPATDTTSTQTRFYFPETKHSLETNFLAYWQKWGGLPVYGYPVSETFTELNPADNQTYTVQYFQRGRFEFHPELAGTKYEVLLGLLGSQQLKESKVPELYRAPQPAGQENKLPIVNPIPQLPLSITPLRIPSLGYGMNVWLFWQDKQRVLDLLKGAGFDWIRQQVGWDALEPQPGLYQWDELDNIVNATSTNNVKILLSVVRAPRWAGINGTTGLPANPATYGKLMSLMAERYKGKVMAYEVWNEQNLSLETGGRVAVAPYIETLKAGYKAIKAADPQAIVLYGGLSPTGIDDENYARDDVKFLEQCYQYNNGEMRNYFDVLGAHPGGAANSPDEFYPTDAPVDKTKGWTTHPSFYFRRIEQLRAVMEKYGDGVKQLWLTEFGWTTKNQAKGYEYGDLISEETQAKYLVRAYQRAKSLYPWMGVMTMWQLNFATFVGPEDEKGPWGLVRADWSTRPSYEALKAMPK